MSIFAEVPIIGENSPQTYSLEYGETTHGKKGKNSNIIGGNGINTIVCYLSNCLGNWFFIKPKSGAQWLHQMCRFHHLQCNQQISSGAFKAAIMAGRSSWAAMDVWRKVQVQTWRNTSKLQVWHVLFRNKKQLQKKNMSHKIIGKHVGHPSTEKVSIRIVVGYILTCKSCIYFDDSLSVRIQVKKWLR